MLSSQPIKRAIADALAGLDTRSEASDYLDGINIAMLQRKPKRSD